MVEHNQSQYYGNQYKFNGKELDSTTGMYYYGARYYEPRFSIFVSVDPLAEQTMDSYGYVYNNPINLIDPTGMGPEDWFHNTKTDELYFLRDVKGKMSQEAIDKYGLGGKASDYENLGSNNVMGEVSHKFTGENLLERESVKISNSEQFMEQKGYMHIKQTNVKETVFNQKGFSFDENISTSQSIEKVLDIKIRYIKPQDFKIERELKKTSFKSTFSSSETRFLRRQVDLNSNYLLHGVKPVKQDISIIQHYFKEAGKFLSDQFIDHLKEIKNKK